MRMLNSEARVGISWAILSIVVEHTIRSATTHRRRWRRWCADTTAELNKRKEKTNANDSS